MESNKQSVTSERYSNSVEALDVLQMIADFLNAGTPLSPDALLGETDETAKDRINRIVRKSQAIAKAEGKRPEGVI